MEVKEEVLDILEKVWTKLQGLPQASPLELGAFFVFILFVGEFLYVSCTNRKEIHLMMFKESKLARVTLQVSCKHEHSQFIHSKGNLFSDLVWIPLFPGENIWLFSYLVAFFI